MSGQDKWLGKKVLPKTVLGAPLGMSKAPSAMDNGVSTQARANKLVMSRRLNENAMEMRTTLVKRATVRRSYSRKKARKKKVRPMTEGEEELALLEPLEFASQVPPLVYRLVCCCGSVTYSEISGPGAAAGRLFRMTDSQLRGCKKCFESIDTDDSGTITQHEFFEILDIADTPFTRNLCNKIVFDIADSDQNNTLSFDEFVLGVCVVCTLTRDQLLYFVFRCFDIDDSGSLSHNEFVEMSEAIQEAGGGFFDGNFSQLLEKFDANGDGNVDFGEFLLVDTYFPMAFFPVFRMQDALRRKTLTPDIWNHLIAEYDRTESRRAAERDVRTAFVPPRPFVERIAKLGAMSHLIEEGGVNALQLSQLSAAKNTGGQSTLRTNRSGSGASTDRSDSDSEMGTQRQTDRPLDSSRQVTFREEGPESAPPTVHNRMDTVPEDQEEDTANASSSSNAAGLVVPSFDLAKMPVGGQGRGEAPQLSSRPGSDRGRDTSSARLSTGRDVPGRGNNSGFKVSLGHAPSWRPNSHLSPEQVSRRGSLATDARSGRQLTSEPWIDESTGQEHADDAAEVAASRGAMKKKGGVTAALRKSITRPGSAGSGNGSRRGSLSKPAAATGTANPEVDVGEVV